MQLLSPQKINQEKKAGAEESRIRVMKLAKEENDLVMRVNLLRQDEEEYIEKKRIRDNPIQPELAVRKTELEREVDSLEARKAQAMKPVDELLQQAKDELKKAEDAKALIEERERALEQEKSTVLKREKAAEKREADAALKEKELDDRVAQIEPAEQALKLKVDEHSAMVAAHSEKVKADDEAMRLRETKLSQDQHIVEAETERQRQRDIQQNARDRQLQAKYAALAAAIKQQ